MKRFNNITFFIIFFLLPLEIFSQPKNNNKKLISYGLREYKLIKNNIQKVKTKMLTDVINKSMKPSGEMNFVIFIIEYTLYVKRMREIAKTGIDPMDYTNKHVALKNKMFVPFNDSIKLKDKIRRATDIKFIIVLPPFKF